MSQHRPDNKEAKKPKRPVGPPVPAPPTGNAPLWSFLGSQSQPKK